MIFLLISSFPVFAQEGDSPLKVTIEETIDGLWEVTWERFYLPKTNQFYDYLSSYEAGHDLGQLPTVAEVQRRYPN